MVNYKLKKCYTINLKDNIEKGQHATSTIKQLLADYNDTVEWELYPAVNGKQLKQQLVVAEWIWPSWMSPGMVGCALSHFRILNDIILSLATDNNNIKNNINGEEDENENVYLITEDDISMVQQQQSVNLNKIIGALPKENCPDIVLLGWLEGSSVGPNIPSGGGPFFRNVMENFGGTHGYLVTLTGARKILSRLEQQQKQQQSTAVVDTVGGWLPFFKQPIDIFLSKLIMDQQLIVWALASPPLLIQDPQFFFHSDVQPGVYQFLNGFIFHREVYSLFLAMFCFLLGGFLAWKYSS